jgi:hypothetical protein
MTKKCPKCQKTKGREEFWSHSRNSDGLASRCIACEKEWRSENKEVVKELRAKHYRNNREKIAERHREYHAKNSDAIRERKRGYSALNPEVVRRHNLKKKFGLTLSQYDEMLSTQCGVCAICGGACATGRRLSVDHCHSTGKVRGLLCVRCNLTLGKMDDNPSILRAAADYVERFRDIHACN